MPSSISVFDGSAWRRFAITVLLTTAATAIAIFAFIAIVDPWNVLPLSPPLARVPISTNARYSFPALARDDRFDAVLVGTSTARLMRPDRLDQLLGVRLANLAMNSATAWEQSQLLMLFLRHHPAPKLVLIDLDAAWCHPNVPIEKTARPFPIWMYSGSAYQGYANIFNLYALQEAANQFAVMVGLKHPQYGLDGYTDFLPSDDRYDASRVDRIFRSWGPPDASRASDLPLSFATSALLLQDLAAMPPQTRRLLFFPPITAEQQGGTGSELARRWASCKADVLRLVDAMPNTDVIDFMIASPVTQNRSKYWDPLHYRVDVADQMMMTFGRALADDVQSSTFYRVLQRARKARSFAPGPSKD